MQTWTARRPSPIAERFWSLAEAAQRGVAVDRSRPVGVVRHILDILAALQAARGGVEVAPSTRAFLSELGAREAAGDLSYTAPERVLGEDSGERALVFSIGVLLFEGLTGRHPGLVTEGSRRGRISPDELALVVSNTQDVPASLRGLLTRAMRPDPFERFASVAELRAELEWFVVAEEEEGVFALKSDRVSRYAPVFSSVPAVIVEGEVTALLTALPAREPRREGELDLETALVPRLSIEDLQPVSKRPSLAIPVVGIEIHLPRRSEPRRRSGRIFLTIALTVGLAVASAAFTALALALAQRL